MILALDSTATVASVAICRDETPIAAFTVNNGNTHSETLLPMVEAALASAGLALSDIELFAASVGPGSFTGVRIGTATVKGLAFGTGKPCIGVSTLLAHAENLLPFGGILCPVMNARRGQVYNALFRANGTEIERLCPDRALSVADLCAELKELGEPFALSGDGIPEFLAHAVDLTPAPISPLLPAQNAVSVAKCALQDYLAGARGSDADLTPVYLRLPQAERERLERLSKA